MDTIIDYADILKEYDVATLARWEATFNAWQWPDDYPLPRPETEEQIRIKSNEMWKIHSNLNLVPFKEFLRAWNVAVRKTMTDEQFEAWWLRRKSTTH